MGVGRSTCLVASREKQITHPFLSIVIPAYNEEQRIIPTLEKVAAFLAGQGYEAEVVVVDDGSTDATADVVEEFGRSQPNVRVVRNPHRGKGGAVKTGMLAATGELRFLCDADLSMPIEELPKFLRAVKQGYDVAIGSREVAGARRFDEPGYRHLMGRVFNLVVQTVAVPGFHDTQCGFKCFRAATAEDLFSRQLTDGFGFDVEILFLARRRGYRITEIPIDWYHVANSKVSPVQDTARMFREALAVRWNDIRGRYEDRSQS